MPIVDMIIKVDNNFFLKEVTCFNECKKWFDENSWQLSIGQRIDFLFDIPITSSEGIAEINSRFFNFQWVKGEDGRTLYLSCDGVLLNLFEQTIKQVAEGVQIYDKNGYFLYGNPASEDLEQYKTTELRGKHVLEIYDLKEEYSTVLTVLRTQRPVINRCDRFKIRTGKVLTTINSGYPLKIGGKLYGAVVFESDLSVLKQIKKRTFNLETYVEGSDKTKPEGLYTFDDIIHASDSMRDVIQFAKRVSLTDSSILIMGATGTGKELIAQSIHSFSPRRYKPFIDVNCSAVPHNLFESMFFGTEKGAYTGSLTKKGFFEMADGGTIFLDEINSISTEMQAKLLRVLQEKRFQRIGGSKYIHCDIRIISASNEDFLTLMEQHKVRKDFYYRISTIKLNISALAERKEDIPILAEYFLDKLCKKYNRQTLTLGQKALAALFEYDWPGNIRELQHVLEHGFNQASEEDKIIEFDCLPDYLQSARAFTHKTASSSEECFPSITSSRKFQDQIELYERKIIIDTLKLFQGNVTQSARALGLSRQCLQYRMKKLEIAFI